MMKDEELMELVGGASILSGTFINSISKLITTVLDLGRAIGSSIKYAKKRTSC